MKKTLLYTFCCALIFLVACAEQNNKNSKIFSGDFVGQPLPRDSSLIFAEGIISTEFNERDMAISPDGNEMFFTLKGMSFHSIIQLKRTNNIWGNKTVAPFSGRYSDLEPCFSADGTKLIFVSNRPVDESIVTKDYDIWYVEKTDSGWGTPINPGGPLNTEANEFYPSVTKNGKLYFCARTESAIGGEDLFYSEFVNGNYQTPVNLGDSINTERDEFNAFVSPDEKFIIYTSTGWGAGIGGGDLWISFKNENDEWRRPINMGEKVNSPYLEFCPSITPDGMFLFFTSNRTKGNKYSSKPLEINEIINGLESTLNGGQNVYWINAEIINTLKID